jgi:hypothetical protein
MLDYAAEVRVVLPPPSDDMEITDFVFALQFLLFVNQILLIFVNHTKNLPACITILDKTR